MDLLDSILNGMEKPPSVKKTVIKDEKKRAEMEKARKERHEKMKKQREQMELFRRETRKKIEKFVQTPVTDEIETIKLELEPMCQLSRTVVHEICEDYEEDIVVHSFGTEEIDRHCVIWKKNYEPCEDELKCMKYNVKYDPEKFKQLEQDYESAITTRGCKSSGKDDGIEDKFRAKYDKIIGNEAGVEGARVAVPAKQYGFVPVANKRDQRSIEQMMDDIKKNKKAKLSEDSLGEGSSSSKQTEL